MFKFKVLNNRISNNLKLNLMVFPLKNIPKICVFENGYVNSNCIVLVVFLKISSFM